MAGDGVIEALLIERRQLAARLEQEQEQLHRLQAVVADLGERIAQGERMLSEINSVLGKNPQLRFNEADVRLRGRELERVAVELVVAQRREHEEIHYREWFELVRSHGHLIGGKHPLNTFLAQINRSDLVEKVGGRSGLYRVSVAA